MVDEKYIADILDVLLFSKDGDAEKLLSIFRDPHSDFHTSDLEPLLLALEAILAKDYDYAERLSRDYLEKVDNGTLSSYYVPAAVFCARILSRLHRHDESLNMMLETLASAPMKSPKELMAIHFKMGSTQVLLRRYPEAMASFSIAHEVALSLQDSYHEAVTYSEMANVSASTGDTAKSIMMYEQSLLTFGSIPNVGLRIVECRINLASLYQNIDRNEDALVEYEVLLTDDYVCKTPHLLLAVLLNKAIALKRLDRIRESLSEYNVVFSLARKESKLDFQIRSLIGISELHATQNNVSAAKSSAVEALELTSLAGGEGLYIETMANLASVERTQGNIDGAIDRLVLVFEQLIEIADNQYAILYGDELVDWLAEAGRYEEAVKTQDRVSDLQKSVYEHEIERASELTAFRSRLDLERDSIRLRDEERNKILNAVMPQRIAERLMLGEVRIADHVPDVTILFVDVVGFTEMAAGHNPEELVRWLETLFTVLDSVFSAHGCERIKTIGDSYMAISGASDNSPDHTEQMVRAALAVLSGHYELPVDPQQLRFGLNSGPVIAGVMGGSRLSYDVWGDTVNVAARMEAHSERGRVLCTESVAQKLSKLSEFVIEKREPLSIRGKGLMTTYWVTASR